jgi:hypothetical protein
MGVDDDDDSISDGDDGEDPEDDNQPKSKQHQKPCHSSHPDSRHRFKGLSKQLKHMTPGFILVYFGIICILGATKLHNDANFLYLSTYQ